MTIWKMLDCIFVIALLQSLIIAISGIVAIGNKMVQDLLDVKYAKP